MSTTQPNHPGDPKWMSRQEWEKSRDPNVIEGPKEENKQDSFDDVVVEGWGDEPEVQPVWNVNSSSTSDGGWGSGGAGAAW